MKTATAIKTPTKIRRASARRAKAEQTFMEWLMEEVATGRIIGPKNVTPTPKPPKPQETIDFWPIYEEVRADRF